MRLRLVFTVAAVLALAACGDRQASKTETAARTSIGPATTAACPPQPAPVCPPAAGKFPAKASGAVSHRRAKSGKAARQVAARKPGAGRAGDQRRYESDEAWQDRYAGPGRPIPYNEYYGRDDSYGRDDRYEEQRRYYDRYAGSADGRAWGYQSRGYSESESSTFHEQQSAGPCCAGSSVGAAGFDGRGYLTWPGKVPAR